MSLLREKFTEVLRTLWPVAALVVALAFTLVPVDMDVLLRFLLGCVMLLVGLSIFLLGVDLAMVPIGDYMARETATSARLIKIILFAFLLGFLVTVAEPDLLILGGQAEAATGGAVTSRALVYAVSAGVGLLISLGSVRLLGGKPSYPVFMALAYAVVLLVSLFVPPEFLAIGFDSSGATTGALTTPFVLAFSMALSRVKGGRGAEEGSFGMVGAMSVGPILAVLLLSILSGQSKIQGAAAAHAAAQGVLTPLLSGIPGTLREAAFALAPLSLLFFFLHFTRFHVPGREMGRIIRGLVYALIGLALFLSGAHSGLMDMGQAIGQSIAGARPWLLPVLGFVLGMIVVMAEPAVHVLGREIEDATGGRVPVRLVRFTLSLGVGLAIAGSMARIMIPDLKLWHFLLPGFLLAVVLSFTADPLFVGIAYDAGGVASGPVTATFVLAFAQGAAHVIPTADVLADGFGVIAMVAMAPVVAFMVLGTVVRRREAAPKKKAAERPAPRPGMEVACDMLYDCVVAVVNRGLSPRAIELAKEAGAGGATVLHGRGSGAHDLHLAGLDIGKEKEVVFFLTDTNHSRAVASALYDGLDLEGEGSGAVFTMPSGVSGVEQPVTLGERALTEAERVEHQGELPVDG